MRIDVVTIFPAYLDPLGLSLPGRARREGLLDLRVHDLREWAHDRHRTTDDTPYGGGAGMVMRPEPWGEALDALEDGSGPYVLVVPTPAGERFTQAVAADLATRPRLVFACGRYEGIDDRVVEDASARGEVRELSLGDYVLNGGEVAALAMVEAVVRLLPGVLGNPDSLSEESHVDGLLEYPVFTKPAHWRGRDVPEVLLSGDHGRIRRWRSEEALRRTAERRPDLAHPSQALEVSGMGDAEVGPAVPGDAAELYTLQLACWVPEALANQTLDVPPFAESLADLRAWLPQWRTTVIRSHGRLVGAVRGRQEGETWQIGRLMVVADLRGRGLGRWLLAHVEGQAPPETRRFELVTGAASEANLRRYRRAGYRPVRGQARGTGAVRLTKLRRGSAVGD